MEFMTTEQVKIEAEKGEIPALEASLLHHQQGRDANYNQFVSAVVAKKFHISPTLCACCQLCHNDCNKCILGDNWCVEDVWMKVDKAWKTFIKDYSNANFKAFQEAEGKICTYIKGVLERKRAEQVEKKEDRHGWCQTCKHHTCKSSKHCKDSDKKIEACSGWQPKESKPALIYSIGDRFKDREGEKYILANDGHSGQHFNKLRTGTGEGQVFKAERNYAITEEELRKTQRFGEMTRYWDSQKEELLDLALRAEDLEEFDVNGIGVHLDRYGVIHFGEFILSHIDVQTAFYQKFGQMLATAKRKQKSK